MRFAKTILAAAAASTLSGTGASQVPGVQGQWLTEGGWAKVRISSCPSERDRLCGWIISLKQPHDRHGRPKRDTANVDPALRNRPIVGMLFVQRFKSAGAGRWTDGSIYNPGNGKTYSARLKLNPDGSLKVSGCIFVLCQSQIWMRVAS